MGSPAKLREYAIDVIGYLEGLWSTMDEVRPVPDEQPGFLLKCIPREAPANPEAWDEVMSDIKKVITPGLTHFHSPNFHAYYEAGTCAASVAGDILANGVIGPNFTWNSGPASTELEMTVMDWFGKMLGLPEEFIFSSDKATGGGIIMESNTGSATLMITTAKMKMARQLQAGNDEIDPFDIFSKLVVFTSDQSHIMASRACTIAGVRIKILASDEGGSLSGATLEGAIREAKECGQIPLMVFCTIGTTSTCAFDRLYEIGPICKEKDLWLHVDGAYAGSFCICPELRYLIDGVEFVDSFCCGPQKSMRVHLPFVALWVRDRAVMEANFSEKPAYLNYQDTSLTVDYGNWSPYLTRPCYSLKMWFVLRLQGVEGLQTHMRKQIRLAHEFEKLVEGDKRFEIVGNVVLGLVCFRIKGSDEINERLVTTVNEQGEIFINSTVYKGRFVVRFVVCSALAAFRHIDHAWRVIIKSANQLLGERAPHLQNSDDRCMYSVA